MEKNNSKIFNEKLFALMKEYGVQPNSIGQINEILKKATKRDDSRSS